jgi:tRNA(Ile)-lysidine synthase
MAATRNRKSPDPVSSLRQTLQARLVEWLDGAALSGRRIAVAFSGGRDSVALLHALAALRGATGILPSAVHVHHGLSPQADAWVAFAENFCKVLDVPLHVERVEVPADTGQGLEAAARAERYRVFSGVAADLLLLAHHQDDQAETVLFNLLRGAGVHGAAAMPMLRRLARPAGGELLLGRPWLAVPRAAIDAYLAACRLDHVDDPSNLDQAFSRNHLRHDILPRLEARYPQAASSLANAARRFGEAAKLLDELADRDLAELSQDGRLDWGGLSRLDQARQKNLLHRWLALHGEFVSSEVGLVEFLRQCRAAAADAQVAMAFGGLTLRRWQGQLYRVAAGNPELSPSRVWQREPVVAWCGGELRMPESLGVGLRADLLAGQVEIRSRQGSEVIRLRAGGPSRPLRQLFQERGVPPWERPRLPFLWADGRLAAVGGIGIAAEFQAAGNQPSFAFDWRPA